MQENKGLSRNTKIFSYASFLVDVSSEMVIWILPFFLSSVLAAPVFIIGLIDALREFTPKIVGLFAGFYADKKGKKKNIVIFGYSLSAFVKALLVFATHWLHVLFVVFFERFGKGIRNAPRDALIVMSEKRENLGRAFGFRQMLDTMGAIIGPLIATFILFLFLKDGNAEYIYRLIFTISVIPAAVAVLMLFFIRESAVSSSQDGKSILINVLKTKNFKRFLAASLVFASGQFTIAFFLLRAGQFASIAFIPLFGMAFNILYALSAMPAGYLTDKIGARKSLSIAWVFFILCLIGFSFFPSFYSMLILFALLGLFTAIYTVAPSVFLGKIIQKEQYASAAGLYQGIIGLAIIPANLIAGAIWNVKIFNAPAVFVFPILTTVLAIFLLNFLVRD